MQDKDQRRISTATTSSQTNNMPNQPHHQRQEQEQSKRLKLDPTNHLTPSHPIQQDDRERNLLPENHHANIYSNQDQTSLDPANYHPSSQSQYPSSLIPDHDDQNQLTSLDGEDVSVEPLELTFSWKNSTFQVSLEGMVSIKDLKAVIYSVTSVPPERQKILGLVVGQIPADHVLLSTLEFKLKKGVHFMLLGSPEEESMIRPSGDTSTLDQSGSAIPKSRNSNSVLYMSRVRAKLDELSANLELNIMNPPRAGKKLLVLDLDYTLMDSKAYSDYSVHALDMARPYLHEFLTALWPYYDICIWSATSWRWLESKLVELGMVDGSRSNQYLIQFVLDRRTMFEVTSMRHGKISKHEVKALELIWRKVPEYNETNTVHLDDLSRNFALNPKSGVKISAFKHARANKQDRQLIFLARYFLQISALDDVTSVDHKKWQDCQLPLPEEIRDPLEILDPSDPELAKFKSHHSKPS